MPFFKKKKEETAERGVPFYKTRKFKYGSLSTALIAIFVVVVVVINIIFTLLSDAYSWKLDLTSYDMYSISDHTKQIVNALTKTDKIEISVMYDEDEYPEQFREIIKRFSNLSKNINCTYVDPVVNPAALTSFGAEYSITEGAVVIVNNGGTESKIDDRTKVISFNDMLEQNSETGSYTYKIEECLASAVLYVTKEEIPLVYFINGHGEAGYESLQGLVANNGADVAEVNLNQLDEIDDMARVMVICGPTMDYSEKEIRQLQDFLSNDYAYERDLFVFSNPEAPVLPNLEGFLEEWGMKVNRDLVLEGASYSASTYATSADSAPIYTIPSYTEAEISGVKITADYMSVVPNTSSIELLFEESGVTETDALMTSSEESYSKSGESINSGYTKESGDKEGPFNVAAVATRYRYDKNVAIESHVFLAGSVDMLHANYFNYNGNGEFIFNIYQMMVDENESTIIGASKAAGSTYLTLDGTTASIVYIVLLGVIPLICLCIGVIVYIRRRFL